MNYILGFGVWGLGFGVWGMGMGIRPLLSVLPVKLKTDYIGTRHCFSLLPSGMLLQNLSNVVLGIGMAMAMAMEI